MQAVSPEVLLHDEVGRAVGAEFTEPMVQQIVEDVLADSDRWVRPDTIDHQVSRDIFRGGNDDVAECSSVTSAEISGPLVHIDGVHRGIGVAGCQCVGDRSVPTTDIDEHTIGRDRRRSIEQQELGADVDVVGAEHAAISDQRCLHIGQHEVDDAFRRRDRRLGVEILSHRRRTLALKVMSAPYDVRVIGDPVLRQVATDVTDIDSKLVRLSDDMLATMYAEPGIGLAAPQIGVQKRFFVYDVGEGPEAIVNPVVTESDGEWYYEEGCLSVPGLSWEILRPKQIHVTGYDLHGNEVSLEADELLSRLIQHELDHLDGVLLIDHLDDDTRKQAMKTLRERLLDYGSMKRPPSKDDAVDEGVSDLKLPGTSSGGLVLP